MLGDMTEGQITRPMLLFFLPLFAGNLFQQLYNMVDTLIVGQFVGVGALAAVGATGSVNFLILGFVNGLTAGFAIPVSQAFGAGNMKLLRHRIAVALCLCVGASLFFTPLTMFTTRGLLQLMQTPADIFEDSCAYILIIFGGMSTTIFYNMFACILRAVGDSRSPLLFLTIASVLNIFLDLVLVVGCSMGVAGAALATVISQGISALLCGVFIWKHFPMLRFEKDELRFSGSTAKLLFQNGVPMALQFSVTAIGSITLQSAVNTLGSLVVASVTVSSKVQMLGTLPCETLGLVMATFCGQNIGAGKLDRVRSGIRRGLALALSFAVVGGVLLSLFCTQIAGLFISPDQEGVGQLLVYVQQFTWVGAAAYPLIAVLLVLRNSLQGMGFSALTMFAGVSELVARAGVAFLLVAPLGFWAVTMASPAAWLLADLFLIFAYFRVMRKLSNKMHTACPNGAPLTEST